MESHSKLAKFNSNTTTTAAANNDANDNYLNDGDDNEQSLSPYLSANNNNGGGDLAGDLMQNEALNGGGGNSKLTYSQIAQRANPASKAGGPNPAATSSSLDSLASGVVATITTNAAVSAATATNNLRARSIVVSCKLYFYFRNHTGLSSPRNKSQGCTIFVTNFKKALYLKSSHLS